MISASSQEGTAGLLLAVLPVALLGVAVLVVVAGSARARASVRSPRAWGVAGLVVLAVFVAFLLVATAILRAHH